ncbi:MAG: AAA family ATP:ADP antiporter [Chlamydiales bacterium]|jgi:AAA family ATP:ADP antiporter
MKLETPEFSKLRSFLWPIHGHELKKFIPMFLLFFLILFNYHLLRIAKDALIVTAPKSGAEAIPFLKVWAVMPTAIMLTIYYTRLANWFTRENIFYVMTGTFLAFYTLFVCVLYPLRESLCPHTFANFLEVHLPAGMGGFISIIRYWVFSLFYVFSDAWSNIMVSLLLWGFANDVITVKQSRRFYALFGVGINSAGIAAGYVGMQLATSMKTLSDGSSNWDQTLSFFVCIVILIGLVSMGLFRYLNLYVFTDSSLKGKIPLDSPKKGKKEKMSLTGSLSYLFSSKYLMCITVIVLAYNLVINLTEVMWKTQLKELFPNSSDYTAYMSEVTLYIGLLATFTSYFISGNVIRHFGWRFSAYVTPGIIISTGLGFFYFLYLKRQPGDMNPVLALLGMSPLAMTVFFGSLQNGLSRAAKYTVYDDTKEMAFIPLSPEARFKGKAAIDGLGSRMGKSGGSLLLQVLFITFSSTVACLPYIGIIILIACCIWISAIGSLSKQFEALNDTGIMNHVSVGEKAAKQKGELHSTEEAMPQAETA